MTAQEWLSSTSVSEWCERTYLWLQGERERESKEQEDAYWESLISQEQHDTTMEDDDGFGTK